MSTVNKPSPKVDTVQKVASFEEVCRTATNMKRMPSSGTVQDEVAAKKAKILDLQVIDGSKNISEIPVLSFCSKYYIFFYIGIHLQ